MASKVEVGRGDVRAQTAGWLRSRPFNPAGEIAVIPATSPSHSGFSTGTWLAADPRIRQVAIPVGACWRNPQEARWRIFRCDALAGQSFAHFDEITLAIEVATC